MVERVVINTDGGSRGNPGPSAIGAVVYDRDMGGDPLAEVSRYIGETTNNVAEYAAIVAGLEAASELGASDVLVKADSKLCIEQLAGRWRVKNDRLRELWRDATKLLSGFDRYELQHVRRHLNTEADALVNKALDRRR